jgi:hypothetical protein
MHDLKALIPVVREELREVARLTGENLRQMTDSEILDALRDARVPDLNPQEPLRMSRNPAESNGDAPRAAGPYATPDKPGLLKRLASALDLGHKDRVTEYEQDLENHRAKMRGIPPYNVAEGKRLEQERRRRRGTAGD